MPDRIDRLLWMLGLAAAVSGCAIFQPQLIPPDVRLHSVVLERANLEQQVFRVRLVVTNPNGRALRVSDAMFDLSLEEITLGTGQTVAGFSVPAEGREGVEVRVAADLVRQAPRLWAWMMSGDDYLDYRVTGYVDIGAAGFGKLNVDERGQVAVADLMRRRTMPL